MAFVLADRVQETSTTTGTGTLTLAGAAAGYQAFSAVGDGNSTFYGIVDEYGQWENGIGTYTSSGTTLSRTTVLSSSNSNSLVNFTAGTKNVFVTYPAEAVSPVRETAQASTSGTVIDFTGIPVWAKQITVIFSGVSLSGTSDILVQLGDAGGFETTGYLSTCSAMSSGSTGVSTSTAGMIVRSNAAASVASGIMTIQNLTENSWVAGFSGKQSATAGSTGGGDKTLSDTLTQVRITTVNGTDTFDAGTINIMYS
jgi:hypothetical protein